MSLKYYFFYYHEEYTHFYRIREEGGSGRAPLPGFYLLGGGGKLPPQKLFLEKNLKLFQIKISFDDDFKESVKVTNV